MKEKIAKLIADLYSLVNNHAITHAPKCWGLVNMSQKGVAPKRGTKSVGFTFKGREACEKLKLEKADIDKASALDRALRSAQTTAETIARLDKVS